MKVKIYCDSCKKWYEEKVELPEKKEIDCKIPSPKLSGYTTYSLIHADHILVVDIDYNGDVRRHKVIEKITNELEKVLSKLTIMISNLINESVQIVIYSTDLNMHHVILGVFQQILTIIPEDKVAEITVASKQKILKIDKFQIRICEEVKTLETHKKTMLIFSVDTDNINNILDKIAKCSIGLTDYTMGILYNPLVVENDKWNSFLKKMLTEFSDISIVDAGSNTRIAISLFNLIQRLYQ